MGGNKEEETKSLKGDEEEATKSEEEDKSDHVKDNQKITSEESVSYTHLTLPTKRIV